MWKIFAIFGLVPGGFALSAQDATWPGTVGPASARIADLLKPLAIGDFLGD